MTFHRQALADRMGVVLEKEGCQKGNVSDEQCMELWCGNLSCGYEQRTPSLSNKPHQDFIGPKKVSVGSVCKAIISSRVLI